jgi:hypothetical protein
MLTEFEQIVAEYSDLHKEIFGVRPRNMTFQSLEEAQRGLDALFYDNESLLREKD